MLTSDGKIFNIPADLYVYIGTKNLEMIKTLASKMQLSVIELYLACKSIGVTFEIVSARRAFEEQKDLYDRYNETYKGKLYPPGSSLHEAGMAIDIKVGDSNSYNVFYDKIAEVWKNMGEDYLWGGDYLCEYWHFAIKADE